MFDVQTLLSTVEEIVNLLKETHTRAYFFAPGSIVAILQSETAPPELQYSEIFQLFSYLF